MITRPKAAPAQSRSTDLFRMTGTWNLTQPNNSSASQNSEFE